MVCKEVKWSHVDTHKHPHTCLRTYSTMSSSWTESSHWQLNKFLHRAAARMQSLDRTPCAQMHVCTFKNARLDAHSNSEREADLVVSKQSGVERLGHGFEGFLSMDGVDLPPDKHKYHHLNNITGALFMVGLLEPKCTSNQQVASNVDRFLKFYYFIFFKRWKCVKLLTA